ncbi:MAG: thiosulfate oxidation carrier protein SoxY [Burkholderiaceae bacterium]
MNTNRRDFLKASSVFGLMAAAGLVTMEDALAQAAGWNKAAFDAKTMAESIKAMGGAMPTQSADIAITAPDIAENGAVVPVGVTSKIPDTQAIYLFVEKNPSALTAGFNLPAGTEPTVSTRIKMGQTSNVTAVVKADNKYYFTTKEVKVTLGGCGG